MPLKSSQFLRPNSFIPCFVTHFTVFLAIEFALSFLSVLICKSAGITLVTSFSQAAGKINEIKHWKIIGLCGNKTLHTRSISFLFISTLRENGVKWTQLWFRFE